MKDLSVHIKSFKEISEEYEFAYRSIDVRTSYYNKLISKGWKVPSAGSYYSFSTLSEANELRKNLKLEIDRKYTLELTSAFEAKLVYYFKKVLKRRNPLYAAYNSMISAPVRRGMSYMMYQHILPVYKQELQPIDNIAYANFKNLVEYRNWLAHGRGSSLDDHLMKFDFEYSYLTIEQIITLMPNFPQALK
tara:strand:+ start:295 stop:867 length:573 start_codon:yes stop_codon:yes gene_type:complete